MASYTDAELQEIARWLKDGLSASKIAAAFTVLRGSLVSRNAIIGIVHRNAMLDAIGFASGKRLPAGKRKASKRANGTGTAIAKASDTIDVARATGVAGMPLRPKREPRRLLVREESVLVADGEAYRLEMPVPPRAALGRQPHGVAMRFIDCLFDRCRAPLDLTLEEDSENDTPGGRPGTDMLCCGMRTKALKSYCTYHQTRFRRRVFCGGDGVSIASPVYKEKVPAGG
ncbi:GcrA family cell cycle regulator [Mesorhizobium sangaii]|uniref:GcrA cell cycle regulator n=1 Tax=Mesorhizobium sangaii TaxID=505389 RepID=A0A841PVP5_9HYPH|nr:GcrA family cell cycle regulator [Mesorhizobium sangaii]MBB6412475.1 GcrA cell cycle regulator [Mesorhizobium sangaii]